MPLTRLITPDDAGVITELCRANREFLAPWEPLRDEDFFTFEHQLGLIAGSLKAHEEGRNLPHVILGDDERVVGRVTLNGIVRGAFQSCSLGYWVAEDQNGRGVATAAVGEILRIAFTELNLHRVQAETLPHNTGSRRVLERNGFTAFATAPDFLLIAGRWQDHLLHQIVNPDWKP
ncbi:GNAT family N-acetyltransferase [Phytomonospora sp. NPDC050363]|uniref:GNAT family N-acetyltransferase n=1 Tax=Phytomonospora sp. NPDC050363 TaxID=3155642 RepID=UPI0033D121C6